MESTKEAVSNPLVVGFSALANSVYIPTMVKVNDVISLFYDIANGILEYIEGLINGVLAVVDVFTDYDLSYIRTLV